MNRFKITLILALTCAFATCTLAACLGGGGAKVDQAQIDATCAELRARLVGPTWHDEGDRAFAYRFLDDGTVEEYYAEDVYGLSYHPDELQWEIRYCLWDGDTDYSGCSAEDIENLFAYRIVYTSTQGWDGKTRTYSRKIAFDGDTLLLEGDPYTAGPDWLSRKPGGLEVRADLAGKIWKTSPNGQYWMLFEDGTGLTCSGVAQFGGLAPNEIIDGTYITWGADGDTLYLCTACYIDGEVKFSLASYRIESVEETAAELVSLWYLKTTTLSVADDESSYILSYNWDKIHAWSVESATEYPA